MFKFETKISRRKLFARKGEAMPTAAVEVGLMPRITDNLEFNGREPELASVLSSLITRENQHVRVTASKSFHDDEGLKNQMMALRSEEGFSKPILPPVTKGDEEQNTSLETAIGGKRRSFTVRLQTSDFRELMAYSITSERTYQDILETAVKIYLNDVSKVSSVQKKVRFRG